MVSPILNIFGKAAGLRTNFNKNSFTPISCSNIDLEGIHRILNCPLKNFPCSYLGMPLSHRNLKRADYQPLIDKILKVLAGWKSKLLSIAGRLTLVTSVLAAMPTFQLIVLNHPKWLTKLIDKFRRSFLWTGLENCFGGRCLVKWSMVCRPKYLGGLGIPNLAYQSTALQIRWLWQYHTDPGKVWHSIPIVVDKKVKDLFVAASSLKLGNGRSFKFWHDHWPDGFILKETTPELFKHSRKKNSLWLMHWRTIDGFLTLKLIPQMQSCNSLFGYTRSCNTLNLTLTRMIVLHGRCLHRVHTLLALHTTFSSRVPFTRRLRTWCGSPKFL